MIFSEFSLQKTFDELKLITLEIREHQDKGEWTLAGRKINFLYDKLNEAHRRTAEHIRELGPAAPGPGAY